MPITELFVPPLAVAAHDSVPALYESDRSTTTAGVNTVYQLVISGTPADGTGFTIGSYTWLYYAAADAYNPYEISTAGGPSVTVLGERTLAAVAASPAVIAGVLEATSESAGTVLFTGVNAAPLAVADTSASLALTVTVTGNAPVTRPNYQLAYYLWIERFRGAAFGTWSAGDEAFFRRVGVNALPAGATDGTYPFDFAAILRAELGFDFNADTDTRTTFWIGPCVWAVRRYYWAVFERANDTSPQGKLIWGGGLGTPDPSRLVFAAKYGLWESLLRVPLDNDGCEDTGNYVGPEVFNDYVTGTPPGWLTSGPTIPYVDGCPLYAAVWQATDPTPTGAGRELWGNLPGGLETLLRASLTPELGACDYDGTLQDRDEQAWLMQIAAAVEDLGPAPLGCIYLAEPGGTVYDGPNLFTNGVNGTFEAAGATGIAGMIGQSPAGATSVVFATTTAQFQAGARSLQYSWTFSSEITGPVSVGHSATFALAANTRYRISAWVRVAALGACDPGGEIAVVLAGGSFVTEDSVTWTDGVDPLDTWTHIYVDVLVGATGFDGGLTIRLGDGNYCGNLEVYIDTITVQAGAVAKATQPLTVRRLYPECQDDVLCFAFQNSLGFPEAFFATRLGTNVGIQQDTYEGRLRRYPSAQYNDHETRAFGVEQTTTYTARALPLPEDCQRNLLDFASTQYAYLLDSGADIEGTCGDRPGHGPRWVPVKLNLRGVAQSLQSGVLEPEFTFELSERPYVIR